jgi:hypothetical protein
MHERQLRAESQASSTIVAETEFTIFPCHGSATVLIKIQELLLCETKRIGLD